MKRRKMKIILTLVTFSKYLPHSLATLSQTLWQQATKLNVTLSTLHYNAEMFVLYR